MASKIKQTAEFDRASIEQMEQEIPRDAQGNPTDDIEIETAGSGRMGAEFAVKAQHTPSLGNVLATVGQDESALRTDPRALENMSTAPCIESQVILTPTQEAHNAGASAIAATLENPKGMNVAKIPLDARHQLAHIAETMKNLPTPDAVTFADNRKITISSEVRDVPNQLQKAPALKLLEAIVGEKITARVVTCAMGTGFTAKPHLWLAQRLAYEGSKREIWDKIEPSENFTEDLDGKKEAVVPRAVTKLFSPTVTEQFMIISRIRRISMLECTKIMISRVCDLAMQEKAPKEFVEKYDNMSELAELMAAAE